MIELRSSLLSLAGEFTDKYEPYNTIDLAPAPGGGVLVWSSLRGNAAFMAVDPKGQWSEPDERVLLLPTPELLSPCRGIKTAERRVELDTDSRVANVYTIRKTTTQKQQIPFTCAPAGTKFVDSSLLARVAMAAGAAGGPNQQRLGRFDAKLVAKAVKMFSEADELCVLSAGDPPVGPLRVCCKGLNALVMIAAADKNGENDPAIPGWMEAVAST